MQWILCSIIECSGFYAAWPKASRLNAVDPKQRHWMQRIPCIVAQWILIVCSGVYAARPNHRDWMLWIIWSMAHIMHSETKSSRLNAVDSMKRDWLQCNPCSVVKCIPIECRGFHALWLNAVNSMQWGKMHPDWMQWIPCSVMECRLFHAAWRNGTLLNAVDFMKHDWMQWIPCSMIECSGFYAAWPKASRLNAVDSM